MYIPFICLSEKCEVTDISPPMKPLPDFKWGKGFLQNLFGVEFAERIDELCRDGVGDGATVVELPQPLGRFGYVAVLRYPAGGVALYLIRTKAELSILLKDRARPDGGNHTPLVSAVLSAMDFPTDMSSFCEMCRNVTASPSSVAVKTEYTGADTTMPSGVGAMLLVCCSLICALNGSALGEILLSAESVGTVFRISVSAQSSADIPFVGRGEDLMTLAPYLRGSRSYLRCAAIVARQEHLSVSAGRADGRICFSVVSMPTFLPPPEFKSPRKEDPALEENLTDTLRFILSTLKEQKQ